MQDALEAVEEVFREQGNGNVLNVPRVRAPVKGGILRITAGVLSYRGYYGVKISSSAVFGRNAGRMFCLYREESGELCAIVQVFAMGALRTGAASGIATKYLAHENAATLGVLGSGRQARTQVEAISRVRPIREVKVYSPTREHREQFCRDIEEHLDIKTRAVDSPEQAVRNSNIVVSATTANAGSNAAVENYETQFTLPRLILDTHIWLDWLVFGDPSTAPIRDAVSANRADVFIDSACEAELERVLEYDLGKRRLDAAARAACIAECRRVARRIDVPLPETEHSRLPVCRDPDDQKFLEAALAVHAQYLITRDRALLELARKRTCPAPFLILTPEAFALQQPASECSNRRNP